MVPFVPASDWLIQKKWFVRAKTDWLGKLRGRGSVWKEESSGWPRKQR